MNLKFNNNIKNMKLSTWEKIFVLNYYDENNHKLPHGKNKIQVIKDDIKKYLQELFDMSKKQFEIDSDSPELIREFENEIKVLKQRGKSTEYYETYRKAALNKLAEKISVQLYEEYKHIATILKNENYDSAFKAMILRETLMKSYKIDINSGTQKKKTIIKKRDLNKSIAGHMVLNNITLDYIYENVENYENFASLYFMALDKFSEITTKECKITLEGVETYGKGEWLKFEGKNSNEEEYLENAGKLTALVKDTPWCTKTLASSQLTTGDFFVFVDNEGKPHIAVKTNGYIIDEVRGILNGKSQELEEEYRDVAISFLEKNKEIVSGKKWLEKEEWNKRLIEYSRKIDSGEITTQDIPELLNDVFVVEDYRVHDRNSNKENLIKKLEKIKKTIAEYFCGEDIGEIKDDEICIEDINFSSTNYKICPYKIILGNADFGDSKIEDLGDLKIIYGNAIFSNSQRVSLDQLKDIFKIKSVGGDSRFGSAIIKDFEVFKNWIEKLINYDNKVKNGEFGQDDIPELLNTLYFKNLDRKMKVDIWSSKLKKHVAKYYGCSEEEVCYGDAKFKFKDFKVCPYKIILGNADFEDSTVNSLGNLELIAGDIHLNRRINTLAGLNFIGGKASFRHSSIDSLENVCIILGDVDFRGSRISSIGKCIRMGGNVIFNKKIKHIENVSIGGDVDIGKSQIEHIGDNVYIEGNISWGEKVELKKDYESRIKKLSGNGGNPVLYKLIDNPEDEIIEIAKRQGIDEFFKFLDLEKDRTLKSNIGIYDDSRGEE